jgi:hypothetical protein
VGFVVDKVALGQVFSEYLGFLYQSSFHQMLYNHPGLSTEAGTIGQKWPQYKRLSPTPLAIKKKKGSLFLISNLHPTLTAHIIFFYLIVTTLES